VTPVSNAVPVIFMKEFVISDGELIPALFALLPLIKIPIQSKFPPDNTEFAIDPDAVK
tara:strand:+ start:348 stop:521 length:174 start_codon:yes stop_codon:yes gene_type:complete